MSDSNSPARPLSPHLQVYRPQLTSMLSILHRGTGIALSVGTVLLAVWIIALAAGPDALAPVHHFMGSWIGLLLLFGWTFAIFYHLANGIRHLFWDAGYGLELESAYASGYAVVAASVVLTVITWGVALAA